MEPGMSVTTAGGKEQQNKAFTVSSRRLVAEGSDVFVKEFTLAEQEEVPWHHHSEVFDIFYCLEGQMTIELKDVFTAESLPTLALSAGESARVEVGTAHRPFNPGPGQLRFLLIQGVGQYDWLPFNPK
jgi:mannose-6-phosphate isomerase-like protein (cupin superfamily)